MKKIRLALSCLWSGLRYGFRQGRWRAKALWDHGVLMMKLREVSDK